jgi:hypothetical protein
MVFNGSFTQPVGPMIVLVGRQTFLILTEIQIHAQILNKNL